MGASTRRFGCGLAAGLLVLAAACGGGGGSQPPTSTPPPPATPCLQGAPAGECVGITDGADNLATDPQFDPVFAAISQENARVNGLGKTVSIVYALPLPRKPSELSAELKGELEGAYLLQRRANDPTSDISGQPFIKLLVANVGERADGWQPVVTRIEQMLDPAQQGNVIGVAGLGQSFQTVQDAMRELARVRVPMVPARLTADNISPQPGRDGVFRIAPPNSKQVAAAATFLTNSCRPVLIQDIRQGDLYVDDLTSNFPQLTTAAGARSASCLAGASDLLPAARYDSSLPGVDTALQQRIPDICVRNPDTIYFGGRGSDLPAFIAALGSRDTRTCPGPITVVTADDGIGIAAEVARQNAPGAAPTLPNALRSGVKVVVTGIAHPGLWGPNPSPSNPALLALTGSCDRCLGPVFPGQTLDDGTVIMGHDAALVLVKGVRAGVNQQSQTVANTTVLQSLLGFGASRPVAGASGAIGFDATGAPIDKAVPLLTIDDRGAISYAGSS